jgi:hypothetical protein
MSNPAVIVLDSINKRFGSIRRFAIEDNIGEAIHVHVDNLRLQFTVKEYLAFAELLETALNKLEIFPGYAYSDFDPKFLKNCLRFLDKLYDIRIEHIPISDLYCIKRSKRNEGLFFTKKVKVNETAAYRYLSSLDNEFLTYPQDNYAFMNNKSRLERVASLMSMGYPVNNSYIILFNNQNIIMDGQHRVAYLAHKLGLDAEIPIMRFYFRGWGHIYISHLNNIYVFTTWLGKKLFRRLFR